MYLFNTHHRYGTLAQIVHWSTAVLVIVLFALGLFMVKLAPETAEEIKQTFFWYSLHKTLGLSVLTLSCLRVALVFLQPRPASVEGHNSLEVAVAHIVHWMLYALIFLMPLTGWLHHSATEGFAPIWGPFPERIAFVPATFEWQRIFAFAHYTTAYLMAALVLLHIAGAFKHQVVDRDGTLRRMLPTQNVPKVQVSHSTDHASAFAALGIMAFIGALAFFALRLDQPDPLEKNTNIADGWTIDHAVSSLSIEVDLNTAKIRGQIASWSGDIAFDPDRPEDAVVEIRVDVASLTLGQVTDQALAPAYLNAAEYPRANFTGQGFVKQDDGTYTLLGMLDLAGTPHPSTLEFRLKTENDRAYVEGATIVLRNDHAVGPTGGNVGPKVRVTFALEATRD